MAHDHGEPPIEDRYVLLQRLYKHQMMINETLKSELSRLSTLYHQVSSERSLLLNELLDHHASCSNAVLKDNTENLSSNFRRKAPYEPTSSSKRSRQLHSPNLEVNSDFPSQTFDTEKVLLSEDEEVKDVNWIRDKLAINKTSDVMPSETRPLAAEVNSQSVTDFVDTTIFENADSPPTIPTTHIPVRGFAHHAKPQQTSKVASLLASSIISNSNANQPFSQHMDRQNNCSPVRAQSVRNIQTPSTSVSVNILNSNQSKPPQPQIMFRNPTSLQAVPNAGNLKLPSTASGQRIFIQQTTTNSRSIIVHPSKSTHQSNQTGDSR